MRQRSGHVGPLSCRIFCAIVFASSVLAYPVQAAPTSEAARAQQEDILAFRQHFLNVDRSYSRAARAEAERRLASLEQRAGALSAAAFAVELCRIVALADNGHSTCYTSGARVGLTVAPFPDGWFVMKTGASDADLLGSRLVSIDGVSIVRVRRALRSLAGGTPEHRDLQTAHLLARPDVLHALDITCAADAAVYRFRTSDGRIVERRLATPPPSEWANFQPAHSTWSDESKAPFRFRDAPELDAVIVQLRQNVNSRDVRIAEFLEDAERARARLGRTNVVLDMRWNGGGNFLLTRDFMSSWPGRVPQRGRFFVLTGPATFSAGIASVAYLKQAGLARVVIVGESVGDRLTFFAENNRPIQLPNSKVVLIPALERDDFRTGCRGYDDCLIVLAQPGSAHATPSEKLAELEPFGRQPLEVASLAPDAVAPWTFADYAAGGDPAIAAVLVLEKPAAEIAQPPRGRR